MSFREVFAQARRSKRGGYIPTLGSVRRTTEFSRIENLPRRVFNSENYDDVTPLFAKTGVLSFRPIQSAALIEAAQYSGLFAPIGIGHGKTLIGLSLPEAFGAKNAVYLVKPDLKRQLMREAETFYGKHFNLPLDRLTVIAYSELSSAKSARVLEDGDFDCVIADECHALKRMQSARTKRFLRFAKERPTCKFAFLSGTIANRSILDYAHLIELALRKNSPLPKGYYELREWAGALDVKPEFRCDPGALKRFCKEGESTRDGYRRRLLETPGVVSTQEESASCSIVIRRRGLAIPEVIKEARKELNQTWAIGDKEISEASQKTAVMKQLGSGFWYRWDWPGGEPDQEWLQARNDWNREVRNRLKHAGEGFDSQLLLQRAAERYRKWMEKGCPSPRPEKIWVSECWATWRSMKDRYVPEPPTVPVWIDDYVVDYAIKWGKKQKSRAIIWADSRALQQRIAEKGNLPLYGAGADANDAREPVIVCSIDSQKTGKNLQYHYSKNLICDLPPNGETFEQLVGRTHRPGQEDDEVYVEWLAHTDELDDAMAQVIEDCEFQFKTSGQRQAVLIADTVS